MRHFIFNKDLTLEMVPDPDQHSWESDVFGHDWRAFAITINGYTRDPMRKICEGLNSTLQTTKTMTELRCALFHLQRHDHWQGINDDAMEEEVRQILRQVVKPADTAATSEGLGSRIHNHFARLGGAELELPSRGDTPAAPDLMNAHTTLSHQQGERQNRRFNRY